jgi:hypothetical protein
MTEERTTGRGHWGEDDDSDQLEHEPRRPIAYLEEAKIGISSSVRCLAEVLIHRNHEYDKLTSKRRKELNDVLDALRKCLTILEE